MSQKTMLLSRQSKYKKFGAAINGETVFLTIQREELSSTLLYKYDSAKGEIFLNDSNGDSRDYMNFKKYLKELMGLEGNVGFEIKERE